MRRGSQRYAMSWRFRARWRSSRKTPLWALWAWVGLPAETRTKSVHERAWRKSPTDFQIEYHHFHDSAQSQLRVASESIVNAQRTSLLKENSHETQNAMASRSHLFVRRAGNSKH